MSTRSPLRTFSYPLKTKTTWSWSWTKWLKDRMKRSMPWKRCHRWRTRVSRRLKLILKRLKQTWLSTPISTLLWRASCKPSRRRRCSTWQGLTHFRSRPTLRLKVSTGLNCFSQKSHDTVWPTKILKLGLADFKNKQTTVRWTTSTK